MPALKRYSAIGAGATMANHCCARLFALYTMALFLTLSGCSESTEDHKNVDTNSEWMSEAKMLSSNEAELTEHEKEFVSLQHTLIKRELLHSAPTELALGETGEVVLVIPGKNSSRIRQELENNAGRLDIKNIALSRRIQAKLSGLSSEVEILPDEAIEKYIVPGETAEFRWIIKPKTSESFTLNTTILNVMTLDGNESRDRINAATFNVEVNATRFQKFKEWWSDYEPIWGIVTLILGCLAVWTVFLSLGVFFKKIIDVGKSVLSFVMAKPISAEVLANSASQAKNGQTVDHNENEAGRSHDRKLNAVEPDNSNEPEEGDSKE